MSDYLPPNVEPRSDDVLSDEIARLRFETFVSPRFGDAPYVKNEVLNSHLLDEMPLPSLRKFVTSNGMQWECVADIEGDDSDPNDFFAASDPDRKRAIALCWLEWKRRG